MSLSFQRLASITPLIKKLVNGYIRKCQNELFGDIANDYPYYNIPQLVNNHCILFYEIFKWYTKKHGDDIEFISDTEVKYNGYNSKLSTCSFENEISSQFCDTFSITFKLKSLGSKRPSFDIGYVTGDSLDKSIKDWNKELAESVNQDISWGFCFYVDSVYYLHDNSAEMSSSTTKYCVDDSIKLLFDFKDMKVRVYHNDKELDCRDLNADKLWIGLTLFNQGTILKMVDYKYD